MQLLHSQDVAPQHFSHLWAELWVLLKHGHVKYVVLIILCAEKYFVFFPWDTGKFTQYSLAIYSIVDAID